MSRLPKGSVRTFCVTFPVVLVLALTTAFFSTKMYRIQYQGAFVGHEVFQYFATQLAPFNEYFSETFGDKWQNKYADLNLQHIEASIAAQIAAAAADVDIDQTLANASKTPSDENERKLFKRHLNFFPLLNGLQFSSLAYEPDSQTPLFEHHVRNYADALSERLAKRFLEIRASLVRVLELKEQNALAKLEELKKSGCDNSSHPHFSICIEIRATLAGVPDQLKRARSLEVNTAKLREIVLSIPVQIQPLEPEPLKTIIAAILASLLLSGFLTVLRFTLHE